MAEDNDHKINNDAVFGFVLFTVWAGGAYMFVPDIMGFLPQSWPNVVRVGISIVACFFGAAMAATWIDEVLGREDDEAEESQEAEQTTERAKEKKAQYRVDWDSMDQLFDNSSHLPRKTKDQTMEQLGRPIFDDQDDHSKNALNSDPSEALGIPKQKGNRGGN